jgi:hypothetical protein
MNAWKCTNFLRNTERYGMMYRSTNQSNVNNTNAVSLMALLLLLLLLLLVFLGDDNGVVVSDANPPRLKYLRDVDAMLLALGLASPG